MDQVHRFNLLAGTWRWSKGRHLSYLVHALSFSIIIIIQMLSKTSSQIVLATSMLWKLELLLVSITQVKGQETCMLPLLTLTKLVEAPTPALLLPPLSTFMSIICVVWFQASTMSHSLLQKLWHKLDDWVKMVHKSFAMQLAALGMTLAEATYLGDLIYL
ncbi:hypothetical protein EDD17DRAFT_1511156 [Pisolithus thermaeus]|nr:hypothetical protein EDD17DRAFT_1511156 [Pisolithus thermaeus]